MVYFPSRVCFFAALARCLSGYRLCSSVLFCTSGILRCGPGDALT